MTTTHDFAESVRSALFTKIRTGYRSSVRQWKDDDGSEAWAFMLMPNQSHAKRSPLIMCGTAQPSDDQILEIASLITQQRPVVVHFKSLRAALETFCHYATAERVL